MCFKEHYLSGKTKNQKVSVELAQSAALLTEAFFCNLSSNFCHEKKSKF